MAHLFHIRHSGHLFWGLYPHGYWLYKYHTPIFFTTLIASCKHKNYVDHRRSSWKGDLTHGAHNLWPVLDSLQKSVHICAVRIHPQAWQAS